MEENNDNKKRRSIRDIPLSENKKPNINRKADIDLKNNQIINLKKTTINNDYNTDSEDRDQYVSRRREPNTYSQARKCKPKNNLVKIYLFLFASVIIVAFFFVNFIFSGATINIGLKTTETQLNETIFVLNEEENTFESMSVPFKTIELEATEFVEITAEREEMVRQRASGKIMVYNEHSSNNQNWIQNTRFESPNGLIFRTPTNLTIPGYTGSGSNITPGTIEIEIQADEFGERYNVDEGTRFTIPAFAGQPSFNNFYAIATTPISGGFDGVRRVIDEEDLLEARSNLESEIKKALINKIESEITDDFLAFYTDNSFTFLNIDEENISNDKVKLTQTGRVELILVKKTDLAISIAYNQVIDYNVNEKIKILNIEDLIIEHSIDGNSKILTITGNTMLEWQIDKDMLRSDVSGLEISKIKDILINYREIASVTTEISPFWRNSFPENVNRIKINQK